jgi:chromosomal replication initiator protein
MENNTADIWERAKKVLKMQIDESDYLSWIQNMKPVDMDDNYFLFEVDNVFIKDRIDKNFKDDIIRAFEIVDPRINKIEIRVEEKKVQKEESYNEKTKKEPEQRTLSIFNGGYNNLNAKYVFDTFIVGKSNEFAHAAAEAIARGAKERYNPLFMHGGVGLGKTHLMHAIGNRILKKDPSKKVFYCSSEHFTNDLINSLKNDRMVEFRDKYRKLDVLLIDDIQFIAGKDSTQEEFFHTFNELYNAGKHIILSSDRPPKEVDNLEKRLVSRFEWGLIADIQQPDYETRVAILKKKAETENLEISEDVLRYIAEAVNSNIRELEGALNSIVAKASIMKKEINVELVEELFYDLIKTKSKVITKDKIIIAISEYYNIPLEDMKSTKRKKDIAKARQVAMYFLREILQLPFMAIGELFGGKDHTTVMHSVSKVESEMKSNKYFNKDMASIKEKIVS